MNILQELANKFETVELTINKHKITPETIEHYFEVYNMSDSELELSIPKELQEEIIKRDYIVELDVWTSSVGHYNFTHYDYDTVIEEAKKLLENKEE
jgi:hypothetical protein